jgi:hypothetical protein
VDDINSQGFNVLLSVRHFERILLGQKYWGSRKQSHFQLYIKKKKIQRSVTHSRFACAAHQAVTIKAEVCYVRVCNFSILTCIVLAVALIYKILWKAMVFLDFFLMCFMNSLHDTRNTPTKYLPSFISNG